MKQKIIVRGDRQRVIQVLSSDHIHSVNHRLILVVIREDEYNKLRKDALKHRSRVKALNVKQIVDRNYRRPPCAES